MPLSPDLFSTDAHTREVPVLCVARAMPLTTAFTLYSARCKNKTCYYSISPVFPVSHAIALKHLLPTQVLATHPSKVTKSLFSCLAIAVQGWSSFLLLVYYVNLTERAKDLDRLPKLLSLVVLRLLLHFPLLCG